MMNIEEVREYCLQKAGVEESFPFDATTLVFKVGNKMFALLSLEEGNSLNLKCEPEKAIRLREQYSFVLPGFHMNKKHWNTIQNISLVPRQLLVQWIDDSYQLVFLKLSKSLRMSIQRDLY
jgi:predicted DNA-binding protein (MmcQ/YjbR family)